MMELDQHAFANFLRSRCNDLRRIGRLSPNRLELGEMESEVWILAHHISSQRDRPLDFRDAADQEALLGSLYARLVKWPGASVRHALRLDLGPCDDDDRQPTLAGLLRAADDSDPAFRQVLREERLALMEAVHGSYSQAAAYALLLVRVEWELRDLASLLWISVETLRKRIARCVELFGVQPTLFDGIEHIDPDFEPTRRMKPVSAD